MANDEGGGSYDGGSLIAVRERRERVIAQLSDGFARDALDVDEFDRRLALAHRADSVAALDRLVDDLEAARQPPGPQALVRPARSEPPASGREVQTLVAVFGGTRRTGTWVVPRHVHVIAGFGGVELDFREAQLAPGETVVDVYCVFGGAQLVVPPGMAVATDGAGIFGGFEHLDRAASPTDPAAPLLRVRGFALFGGVSVETRLPNETEHDARRRHRAERKAARHARHQRG